MKKLKELYQQSLKELCRTKTIVLCGLLAALAIVLSLVASIQLGPYIKIGFSGLPNRIVEFLFGPVVGCLFGGALDLLKYVLKPDGPFFFGFTFNAMLSGLIYGSLLYRRPVSIKRIVIAEFFVKLVINCGLNTLCSFCGRRCHRHLHALRQRIYCTARPACDQKRDHAADRQLYLIFRPDLRQKNRSTVWIFHNNNRCQRARLTGIRFH